MRNDATAVSPKRRVIKRALWRDLENERTKTIIHLVKRRASLAEIGKAVGITRERARQIIALITREHGEQVFAPDEEIWTASEAACELNTSPVVVHKICAAGEIPCRRRGCDNRGAWLIAEDGMELLRKHRLITRERTCVVCGTVFIANRMHAIVCSRECSDKRQRQLSANYATGKPTLRSLQGWRRDLLRRLESHRIPQDEEWLTVTEAEQRTGLSTMQIIWLHRRRIVTIRPDPVKTWRGRPVVTYAASELEIARQAYESHLNHTGKCC